MATEILMPALSPTMEEGTLAKWLVKEGDVVKSGDILAEIETDKATMEFEAVDEGTIGKIMIAEGTQGVKVNTPIAVLLEEGEDASAVSAPAATEAPETKGGAASVAATTSWGRVIRLVQSMRGVVDMLGGRWCAAGRGWRWVEVVRMLAALGALRRPSGRVWTVNGPV